MLDDLYIAEDGFKGYVTGPYLLHRLEARMDKATKAAPQSGPGTGRGAPNPSVYARVPVKKPQTGPLHGGAIEAIQTAGGLHRVGGKMPASPTGGGAMAGDTSSMDRVTAGHATGSRSPGLPVFDFNWDPYSHATGAARPS